MRLAVLIVSPNLGKSKCYVTAQTLMRRLTARDLQAVTRKPLPDDRSDNRAWNVSRQLLTMRINSTLFSKSKQMFDWGRWKKSALCELGETLPNHLQSSHKGTVFFCCTISRGSRVEPGKLQFKFNWLANWLEWHRWQFWGKSFSRSWPTRHRQSCFTTSWLL